MERDRDLAEQLRTWALDEMRFRPQGRHVNASVPSKDDFKMLCRGAMVDVWKYVLQHVRSTRTVQKIHGNLKLQKLIHEQAAPVVDKAEDSERGDVKGKHSLLTKELLEVRSKVQHLEKEMRALQKEILEAEEAYSDTTQEISDLMKRTTLLSIHSKQCKLLVELYTSLAKQINDKSTIYKDIARKKSADPTYYTSQGIITGRKETFTATDGRSTPTGLESASTRSVRESCERIGSFLHDICKADEENGRVEDASQREIKDQLWTGVENALSQHMAKDVLTSLCRVAQDSAVSLRELSVRIDLKKDAQELKFKYENCGKLTDTSSPPSLLQSVHQLIEKGQAAHFQRFVESERGLNEAWRGRQRLQTLQQQLEANFVARYQDSPGNIELARVLLHNELELAASKASLDYMKAAMAELAACRNERQRAKEILIMKHKKIQDFERLAQTKQAMIQALVKQNSNARTRIEKQKHELLQYIQQKICSHEAHVVAMTKQLQNSTAREVDKFSALPLDQVHYSGVDSARRVPISELSINRLENFTTNAGGTTIRAVLDSLDFPMYKAPEELLPTAMNLKEKVDDAKILAQSRDSMFSEVNGDRSCDRMVVHLNGLRREVAEQDRAQLDYIMPLIQNGLNKTTKALSDCISVKDVVSSWWEQPAQFVVPWVKLDDMNMRQWTDQWTLCATRLRQLQMSH
ncbi:hypothetical protein pdam_00006825 [Pocillopora damicornis]|uniref:Uncharacterized protein n=1 Tax=Pocillopora damicornis TaxID=46731 RepID=A0A3M6V563_POCDA|nr:HAUS augmin-like complex subunit 5 [Pocillopora damicornis]RMX60708.1 hypothetical protein pdam_00006825 [Pocillopora damicornis]